MWNTIQQWLHGLPIHVEVIESVLMVAAALIMRNTLLIIHSRRRPDLNIEDKRRSLVLSRNPILMLVPLSLVMVWVARIQTLVLSMFAVAVAIVVATKELIMCLSDSILRSVTKQYSVGDYIEANGLRGRVVDIDLLSALMMQIGPHPLVGQSSGKTLSFLNSLLLSHYVHRDNILRPYVTHTVGIPAPIHLDLDAMILDLKQVLKLLRMPYVPEISCYLDTMQTEKLFITPAAQSRATRMPRDDKVYSITVCYASPVSKRLETQQVVSDEFLRV